MDPSEILSNDIMRCVVFDNVLQFDPFEDVGYFYEQNTYDTDIEYFITTLQHRVRVIHLCRAIIIEI